MVLKLALLMPLMDLSLRLLGYQRSLLWLARYTPPPCLETDALSLAHAQRCADLARVVGAQSLWPTTCLRQALAVWWLLRRRHLPAELKIGVMRQTGIPFQAHAWVELAGYALDPSAAAHSVFPDRPGSHQHRAEA